MRLAFQKVSEKKKGYSTEEVDAFFEKAQVFYETRNNSFTSRDIQQAAFSLKDGGYDPNQVDSALDRLTVSNETRLKGDIEILEGFDAWNQLRLQNAKDLSQITHLPSGNKFPRGKKPVPSYKIKEVDALLARIGQFFSDPNLAQGKRSRKELRNSLTAKDISGALFTSVASEKGYLETAVDAFLIDAYIAFIQFTL